MPEGGSNLHSSISDLSHQRPVLPIQHAQSSEAINGVPNTLQKLGQQTLNNGPLVRWSKFYVSRLVSASDVMPMGHWLNVWCIWHTKLETLKEFRSHHLIEFIGQILLDFREMCVLRSITFCLEIKMPCRQTPLERRKPPCLQLWRRVLIRIN